MSTITLEFVQGLPIQKIQLYALRHLQNLERKKLWNRKYNSLPEIRMKQRTYYYKKHDIYHPDLNKDGKNEKRFKRSETMPILKQPELSPKSNNPER